MSITIEQGRFHGRPYALDGWCFVYLLCDPRWGTPFYVGISNNPFSRFSNHLHDPGAGGWPYVGQFLKAGFHQDQILKIYKRCLDRNEALRLEHALIMSTPGLINRDRRIYRRFEWSGE